MKKQLILAVTAISTGLIFAPVSNASPEQFQKCLNEHGVNVQLPPHPPKHKKGAPPPAPPGVDQHTWHEALKACKQFAPAPPR